MLCYSNICPSTSWPHSGELRTQKLKSYLVRTLSVNGLPLKPGVAQYIAKLRLLPGISSLLIIFTLPVHSPAFFQNFSQVFSVLAVTDTGACVGPQNKIGHPAGCRFPWWVLAEYEKAKKTLSVFLVLRSDIVDRIWAVVWEKKKKLVV